MERAAVMERTARRGQEGPAMSAGLARVGLPGVGMPVELRTEGASHGDVMGRSMLLRWRSKVKAQWGEGLGVFKEGNRGPCGCRDEPGKSGWGKAGEAGRGRSCEQLVNTSKVRQPPSRMGIFANNISDKGATTQSIQRTHTASQQKNSLNETWAEDLNRQFSKGNTK